MTSKTQSDKDRVVIFDTTLRDGEQCPGATMTHEEKLAVAELLDSMGVDIIEAGFPIASDGDFAAVHEIAKRAKNAVICGLSRAAPKDIDRCAEAIKPAKRKRIHTFISTSPVHMKYKLQKEPHEVFEMVIGQVTRARSHTDDVEWSAEDATRTEQDFLCRCVEAAINAGATTINIPDTVGYTVPEEYFALFEMLRERVPNFGKARFSTHCHNDLGMAVANSLAGVKAGARQIECTINGIGERAGNAALEEIVMAIKTRSDVLPFWTGIDASMLTRASKLVAAATSFPVQYNKAIVGRNAFAHESGIHQDGMLKNAQTYEIMTPESGRRETDLAGHGQAFRPSCLRAQAGGTRLSIGRQSARRRLRALQGAGRQEEADLRRGHRGAGGRGDRARPRSHQDYLLDRDRRHHGPADRPRSPSTSRASTSPRNRPATARWTRSSRRSANWCRTRPSSSSTRCMR